MEQAVTLLSRNIINFITKPLAGAGLKLLIMQNKDGLPKKYWINLKVPKSIMLIWQPISSRSNILAKSSLHGMPGMRCACYIGISMTWISTYSVTIIVKPGMLQYLNHRKSGNN